MDSLRSSPL